MSNLTMPAVAVGDAMHPGVIAIAPHTSVAEVAATMSSRRVHCVVVEGIARNRKGHETLVWGILSDLDLIKALAAGRLDADAGEVAASEVVAVDADERIEDATRLMAEHECSHLVVVSPQTGEPIGVISSLDVAGGVAGAGAAS